MLFFYTLTFYLLLPFILLRLLWRSIKSPAYRQRWAERFGFFSSPSLQGDSIWIHAVSVGEVLAAKVLIDALLKHYPNTSLVLTTTTPTGSKQAQRLFGEKLFHVYAPYDIPGSIQRFLTKIRPRLCIVMETEVWPNTIMALSCARIPVVLANGRLSAKSFKRYAYFGSFTQKIFSAIDLVAAQSDHDASHFRQLGVLALAVTGNIKVDVTIDNDLRQAAADLGHQWRHSGARKILLAASTHEGEEAFILQAFKQLKKNCTDLLLVIVPRHPERFNTVAHLCQQQGFTLARRSNSQMMDEKIDILLGDTVGELLLFCGASDLVVMGGTLVDHGGHNFLEPAAWGVPIVSGCSDYNFSEIAKGLLAVGALTQVTTVEQFTSTLKILLEDNTALKKQGDAAKHYVEVNRGALNKLLIAIAPLIDNV
jgi:3-deoxy-D-manno-octulosonic-acid transferase